MSRDQNSEVVQGVPSGRTDASQYVAEPREACTPHKEPASDRLRAARGLLLGLAVSVAFWALVALLWRSLR
jgi:hypothetical protein